MLGPQLWDNQVSGLQHLSPSLPTCTPLTDLPPSFALYHSVFKTYDGVCSTVCWFMSKYLNVAYFWLFIICLPLINSTLWHADWLSFSKTILFPSPALVYRWHPFSTISNCIAVSRHSLMSSTCSCSPTLYCWSFGRGAVPSWFHEFFSYCFISVSLVSPIQHNIF